MRRAALFLLLVGVLAAPLVAALVGIWAQGWTLAAVQTGSMRPGIAPGAMVVLAPVDPADVEAGSIIGYRDDRSETVITHRVVEVLDGPAGRRFRTQGDANPRPDGAAVPARAVVGVVRWRIAGLGTVVDTLTDRQVHLALIAAPAVLLCLSEVAGLFTRTSRRRIAALQAEVRRLRHELATDRSTSPPAEWEPFFEDPASALALLGPTVPRVPPVDPPEVRGSGEVARTALGGRDDRMLRR